MGPMEERDEEEDDAEEALLKFSGEWILTEEDVQREKEESLARTEAAKAHVKTQEGATFRINAKLTENGEYDLLAVSQGVAGVQRHHSPGLQRGSGWPPALLEGSGSPEQRHSAKVVALEMLRRQERFFKFDKRRKEVLAENEQLQAQIARELEAADLRCAQRQRERLQESRRRAFAAQQRRSEQQKVLRENAREQERIWESYYTKMEREKEKERQAKAEREAAQSAASSGLRAKSSSAPDLAGWLEEEVYKTTLQSHQSYSETIERWRQFEKENERRTEAHKKKLLLSAGYSYRRSSADDLDVTKGDKRFRGAKDGARKSFSQRKASVCSDSTAFAATAPLPSTDSFGGLNLSTMSGGSNSVRYSLKSSKSLPLLSEWETRRENCVRHKEELFQQSIRKLEEKQGSVEEARQRIQAINKEKVERASELNQTWKERNDVATQRRAEQSIKSDDDLVRKFEENTRRREEEMRRQEEHRNEVTQAKTERVKEAQTNNRSMLEKAAQKTQERMQQKDEMCQNNIQTKLKEFEERAASGEYSDIVRAKYEAKVSQQIQFQKKAVEEVEAKDTRSKKVLLQKQQSTVEKCRAERKERKKGEPSARPRGPRLSSQIMPLKDEDTLEKEQEATQRLMRPSRCSLPALASGKRSSASRATGVDLSGEGGRMSLFASELQAPGEELEGGPREGHRHSVLSGVDSDDEGVFLKELESRSVKWLHELRKQKEKTAWKP